MKISLNQPYIAKSILFFIGFIQNH